MCNIASLSATSIASLSVTTKDSLNSVLIMILFPVTTNATDHKG